MRHTSQIRQVEEELIHQYSRLYRLAYSYVLNEDDALDIVQESAYKAIRDCRQLNRTSSISSWIYKIVVHTSLDFLRKRKHEILSEELPEIPITDPGSSIDLKNALSRLDEKSRTVILLRYLEDQKLEDIAEIQGENVNTVKARLYRALKKLRIQLDSPVKAAK